MSFPKDIAHLTIALILASTLLLATPPVPTLGNGAPIAIVLSYLQGVSNWGPTTATGVAELVMKEGEVRLTATGLPPLEAEEYRAWLANTRNREQLPLASFNAAHDHVARLDLVLDAAIPERGWDLLLISVETPGSSASVAGSRRTIAGRFPVPSSEGNRPSELPRTGGEEPPSTPVSPLLVGTLGLTAGWLMATVAWRSRRPSR